MGKTEFSCTIENNSDFNNLGIEFWLDSTKFFDGNIPAGIVDILHEFNEDEADHSLKIILKNKTDDHTTISDDGQLLSDALISVKNIKFDNIKIDQLFFEHSIYSHNFNGTGPNVEEKFYGNLGCNGVVELKFCTPFYMWLMENM